MNRINRDNGRWPKKWVARYQRTLDFQIVDDLCTRRHNPSSTRHRHRRISLDVPNPIRLPTVCGDDDEAVREALAWEKHFTWQTRFAASRREKNPAGSSLKVPAECLDDVAL